MARRIDTGATRALPSREAVLAFIRETPGKVGKREIAKAFGLKAGDRIWLKQMLGDMADEGALSRDGRRLRQAGHLPNVVLAEIDGRDRDGELTARPASWDEDGPAPRIVIAQERPAQDRRGRGSSPAPGVGDRALVRVTPLADEPGRYVGRVIKVLPKARNAVLGIFRASERGGRIVPVDKKSQGREIAVAPGDEGGAREGDLVAVALEREGRFGLPRGRVKERLGSPGSERAVSLIALHAHAIPHVFSRETLAEAEAVRPATPEGREDWRDLALVTIDPPDAKDHDDAVHARPDPDPANAGGFVLTVAIADVAAYVRPGTALDREALERGNSVYFPDRVVPMLPERISNDLCSLRPDEDRPALAVRMTISADGRKRAHSFHRVLMRSKARLAYAGAQDAVEGRPDAVVGPLLDGVIRPLFEAYRALARARDARGPLALDLPERKVLLKPDGTVDRVTVPQRLDAHRLIEEFMILANVAAAETLEAQGSPLVYRVHGEPSPEKMRALGEVLASVGVKLPKDGAVKPALFNRILGAVAETEHRLFINEVVLRSQAQAVYAADNEGHFGLNLRRYAHFTSPIRRYADLIVHRALIAALKLGSDGLPAGVDRAALNEVGQQISAAERRAMAAERDTVDRLIAAHLADRVGATFSGQIAGATRAGLFVKLNETGADGFVPVSTLGADYYRHDEALHALVGERTGETFRLGDRVEVRLVEAAPVAGALRFEMLSEGRSRPQGAGGRGPGKVFRGKPAASKPGAHRAGGRRR